MSFDRIVLVWVLWVFGTLLLLFCGLMSMAPQVSLWFFLIFLLLATLLLALTIWLGQSQWQSTGGQNGTGRVVRERSRSVRVIVALAGLELIVFIAWFCRLLDFSWLGL
ncbi:MAG: hypothetical protein PHX83_11540 [Acidobacteriia bacterium]|nr:hypothetical protein [Terriglobia bacterium]